MDSSGVAATPGGAVVTAAAVAVARYADRFHRAVGRDHHIASPLGAWLLLALVAPAATGPTRDELADILGMAPDDAARIAAELLSRPHPLVVSAAAVWNSAALQGALADWLDSLPDGLDTGDIPTQAAADAWTKDKTLGLIERFPVDLDYPVVLLLATALATKISWDVAFDVVPATELRGPLAAGIERALRAPGRSIERSFIAADDRIGDLAVHVARTGGGPGLAVVSVIADESVPPADVLTAAHRIAVAVGADADPDRRSLFDLALGDSERWTITEEPFEASSPDERGLAIVPAWSAHSEHDLDRPGAGFPAAAAAITDLTGLDRWQARQSAVARFHREGFEAAAVTGMASRVSRRWSPTGLRRTALLRFGRPYAAVAVALDDGGPWSGLPVFSAWITEADEAEER